MNSEPKRILVVDDEPSVTRLLKLNLEQTGDYVVRTENSAINALTAAEAFRPDLVLLDVMMPDVDGGELASSFQEHALMRRVPIVFLTATVTREELRGRHGMVGGQPFLAKPVNLHEVLGCLERHLGTTESAGAAA
jgi:CheY-like chemotaxis protein